MNIEQALIIANELKTEFKIGNWLYLIGERSLDEATNIEIAKVVLNTANAIEQNVRWRLLHTCVCGDLIPTDEYRCLNFQRELDKN